MTADLDAFLYTIETFGVMEMSVKEITPDCEDGHSLHFEHLREWAASCQCQAKRINECSCAGDEMEQGEEEEAFDGEIGDQMDDQVAANLF